MSMIMATNSLIIASSSPTDGDPDAVRERLLGDPDYRTRCLAMRRGGSFRPLCWDFGPAIARSWWSKTCYKHFDMEILFIYMNTIHIATQTKCVFDGNCLKVQTEGVCESDRWVQSRHIMTAYQGASCERGFTHSNGWLAIVVISYEYGEQPLHR